MAYRAIVFLLTVIVAVAAGFFVRRGELEAARAGELWPGVAELRAQDRLIGLRALPAARPDIIIVAADDASVKKYGKLPWSRSVWSRGLRQVQTGGAKVAVFDLALDTRTNRAADRALWSTMANGRRTVLGMGYDAKQQRWTPDDVRSLRFLEKFALADNVTLRGSSAVLPFEWPMFEPPVSDFTGSARGVGVFLRETDQDGFLRHARLLYLSQVRTPTNLTAPLPGSLPESRLNTFTVALPNLALDAARQAFGVDKTDIRVDNDMVRVAGNLNPPVSVPIDSASRMVINYAGPAGTYQTIPFAGVAEGTVPSGTFRDKVVLFGVTASGAEETDRRMTPFGEMPRVEITANAVASILSRSYLARARGNDVLATLIAVGIVAGLLLAHRRLWSILLTGVILSVLYLVVAWCMLSFAQKLLPVVPVLVVLGIVTLLAMACRAVFDARDGRAAVSV